MAWAVVVHPEGFVLYETKGSAMAHARAIGLKRVVRLVEESPAESAVVRAAVQWAGPIHVVPTNPEAIKLLCAVERYRKQRKAKR